MRRVPRALALALPAALLAAGCAGPRAYVVLLPDADGHTGQVVYDGPEGRTTLDRRTTMLASSFSISFTRDCAWLDRLALAPMRARPARSACRRAVTSAAAAARPPFRKIQKRLPLRVCV